MISNQLETGWQKVQQNLMENKTLMIATEGELHVHYQPATVANFIKRSYVDGLSAHYSASLSIYKVLDKMDYDA